MSTLEVMDTPTASPSSTRSAVDRALARVRTRRLDRRLRTPDRALAEIEKLETADLEEIGVAVFVYPSHLGRTTGFEVDCEEHGAMPYLAPNRKAGHLAAARHVLHEHEKKGTVILADRRPSKGRLGS